MFFPRDDDSRGRVITLCLGLAGLVIALAIGVAMQQANRPAQQTAALAASARPVSGLPIWTPARIPVDFLDLDEGGVSVIVHKGVVKFYFAPNQSALAFGSRDALAQTVKAMSGGKTAVISGFHDSTGDATRNVELARQRALAVRHALNALGVSNAQIELKKPVQLDTGDSNAEARRVEIRVE